MPDEAVDVELEIVRDLLGEFLVSNPISTVDWVSAKRDPCIGVIRPWGEIGLTVFLPSEENELTRALNSLILPERFTAIWHKDSKDLEIIWTAFSLEPNYDDIKERSFKFQFEGNEYECGFGESSDRLLVIAENALPIGESNTGHRNLASFRRFVRARKSNDLDEKPLGSFLGTPVSFWVRNIEWNEENVIRLTRHLNFYLTYYDGESPAILIHTPPGASVKKRTRYLFESFPERIDGSPIDDELLQLWTAAREGEMASRFIYYYRIIEFSSHSYIDRESRKSLRRLLAAPHARANLDSLVDEIVSISLTKSGDDVSKMLNLLRDTITADVLWREIEQNSGAFCKQVIFDGGFSLGPLISENTTYESFCPNGIDQFARHARAIRNHLSHGLDRTTRSSIIPTVENNSRLVPWVSAISVVAGEVMNYKNVSLLE